jgi:hypothetical protein
MLLICVKREAEYFFRRGWTAKITLIPFNKIVFCESARPSPDGAKCSPERQVSRWTPDFASLHPGCARYACFCQLPA